MSSPSQNPSSVEWNAPSPALLRGLRRLLRPLVKLLLEQQITYPLLKNLLKEVYVDLADHEFPIEGRAQTTTRVSLLTGIHRKDVRRLREAGSSEDAPPVVVSLGAQLVARWLGDEAFLDSEGHPRPLPRKSGPDGEPSFESLVESVSKDIRARAVLDEWLRTGTARVLEDGRVSLEVGAFVPEEGFDEKAFFFGRNLRDHIGAGAHNLRGGHPPMPDRSVYYDGLDPDSVAELQKLAEELGMEALQQVNRRARDLQKRDKGSGEDDRRMTFGIYFYRGDASAGDDEETS